MSGWLLPPHFPFHMSVFKQDRGSGGVRLSAATSKLSKSDSEPYLDRRGLTRLCTLVDTHMHTFTSVFSLFQTRSEINSASKPETEPQRSRALAPSMVGWRLKLPIILQQRVVGDNLIITNFKRG